MLYHGLSSAQRTLGLFSDPVAYALPAEDVPALGGGRILHLFKTQRAFALLASLDISHGGFVFEMESRDAAHGRVCCRSDVYLAGWGPIASTEQKLIVGCGICVVVAERDVELARVEGGPLALCRGDGGEGFADVEEGLDAHLDGEQDAEELVAAAVGGVGDGAGEDVAQGEEALGELVVGAVEVE